MRLIKIKDDFGNVLTIGTVIDGVFYTKRKRSKHFFVKYGGWALDRKAMEGLDDVVKIIIRDEESRLTYRVDRQYFLDHAVPISNRGHREQLCLPEFDWEKKEI